MTYRKHPRFKPFPNQKPYPPYRRRRRPWKPSLYRRLDRAGFHRFAEAMFFTGLVTASAVWIWAIACIFSLLK